MNLCDLPVHADGHPIQSIGKIPLQCADMECPCTATKYLT